MNSIEFELDEDFTDNDMAQGRVATKSKERLYIAQYRVREIHIIQSELKCYKPVVLHIYPK